MVTFIFILTDPHNNCNQFNCEMKQYEAFSTVASKQNDYQQFRNWNHDLKYVLQNGMTVNSSRNGTTALN